MDWLKALAGELLSSTESVNRLETFLQQKMEELVAPYKAAMNLE